MKCTIGVFVCCAVAAVLCSPVSSNQEKSDASLRIKRGFRSTSGLASARGFGKRDFFEPGNHYGLSVDWMASQIMENPHMARNVVEKYIDRNQDGELSAEELAPLTQ